MPSASRASLRPISAVAIDLTLTTSSTPWVCATAATIAHASSASRAQCTVAPARVSDSSRVSRWVARSRSAASFTAAPATRSSSQSSTSATTAARLSRMVRVAWARLRRSWVSASASRAAVGKAGMPTKVPVIGCLGLGWLGLVTVAARPPRPAGCVGFGTSPSVSSVAARTSARCITRTPARWRESIPPTCIRQELSPATSTSAPVSRTWRALSAPIATDVSAFLRAKVPPKPQHSVAFGRSTSSMPRTASSSRVRSVADAEHPQAVAGRVVGHPVREVGADVGHAEDVDEELAQLVGPRSGLGDGRHQRGIARAVGDDRVLVPCRPGARARRRDDGVVPRERVDEGAHHRHCLVEVAGVDHRLTAARLRLREVDLDPQTAQQPHDGLPRVGEHGVVDAGDLKGDLHALILSMSTP